MTPGLAAEANFQQWLARATEWTPRAQPKRAPAPARQGSPSGGYAVRDRYGDRFFSAIGSRGGKTIVYERGPEYLQQIGARGGAATRRKYGREHYAAIGRKGGQANRGRKRGKALPSSHADR